MNLAEYRAKTTKTVSCPSGAEAVIRQLTVGDFLGGLGKVPGLNLGKIATADVESMNPEQIMSVQKMYLIRGVISFAGARVVDGETDVPGNTISWQDISTDDSNFLVNTILEITNPPRKVEGGAPEGARFPTS